MRLRRIGQNELDVIDLMHGYVKAQSTYRAEDPDGDGLPTFADAIISAAGKRDGLYWPSEPGAPESPVGDFMARAAADGYDFDGTDQQARALPRLLLPGADEAGAGRARRARWTTW